MQFEHLQTSAHSSSGYLLKNMDKKYKTFHYMFWIAFYGYQYTHGSKESLKPLEARADFHGYRSVESRL